MTMMKTSTRTTEEELEPEPKGKPGVQPEYMSLREIAAELGLTFEQVRSAERSAFRKIRFALLARKIYRKDLF